MTSKPNKEEKKILRLYEKVKAGVMTHPEFLAAAAIVTMASVAAAYPENMAMGKRN